MKEKKALLCFFPPRHECLKEQCAVWDEENKCCSFKRRKIITGPDPTEYAAKVIGEIEKLTRGKPLMKEGIMAGLRPGVELLQEQLGGKKPKLPRIGEKKEQKKKQKYWEKELEKMDEKKKDKNDLG